MSPTAKLILRKARDLIAQPEHWTQRAYARYANGNIASLESPEALSYCAAGAVHRVGVLHPELRYGHIEAIDSLAATVGGHLMAYNDAPERTHTEIVAIFDRAMA